MLGSTSGLNLSPRTDSSENDVTALQQQIKLLETRPNAGGTIPLSPRGVNGNGKVSASSNGYTDRPNGQHFARTNPLASEGSEQDSRLVVCFCLRARLTQTCYKIVFYSLQKFYRHFSFNLRF